MHIQFKNIDKNKSPDQKKGWHICMGHSGLHSPW